MCTDSLHVDGQNALEKSLAAATHTAAGVSVIWGVGQVESEKTISPVQAVIDDEIAAAARRFTVGFPVDDASLAVDEVRREGIAGSFLGSDHTLAHFRGTVLEPRHLVRAQRGTEAAATGMLEHAEAFVREVLSRPPSPCLSKEEDRELARIEGRYSVRS
jgi:trimethylamine:corrinoid methyltransferase-like protein